jgi:DSF synthase
MSNQDVQVSPQAETKSVVDDEICAAIRAHAGDLPQVKIVYEPAIKALWLVAKPEPKPVFTLPLLTSLGKVQRAVSDLWGGENARHAPVRYVVCRSEGPIFTLGGDLDFYLDCIATGDRAALEEYAEVSVFGAMWNASGGNGSFITVAMAHEKGVGGGIDAARSCQVMIAEEHTSFQYPEVKFNHFPITAVPVLARRMGRLEAERMLMTGEEYSAEEWFKRGGLEAVVPRGNAEAWVRKYCADTLSMHHAKSALFSAFHRGLVTYEDELRFCAKMWVDCMLRMTPMEVSKLQRIAQMQEKMLSRMYAPAVAA